MFGWINLKVLFFNYIFRTTNRGASWNKESGSGASRYRDLAFIDANHKEEPTMRYFEQCLKLKTENSCFVFDDIYWSEEMKNAWERVKNHDEVSVSIDLFFVGLVFFRKGIMKQHFILK